MLELYAQYPALSENTLKAEAAARGRLLAAQINRLADAGGRIILPTLPDMGLTPFAIKENTAKADPNRAKLLTSLTAAFNSELTLKVTLDGRQLGVVFGDELFRPWSSSHPAMATPMWSMAPALARRLCRTAPARLW